MPRSLQPPSCTAPSRTAGAALAAVVAAAAVLLAGCGSSGSSTAAPVENPAAPTVIVKDFAFAPTVIHVSVGTTVTWIFKGQAPHDVDFSDGIESPIKFSGTWTRTFAKAGTYDYSCSIHPIMTATVIVS
jgi:plastocyanin